MTPLFLTFDQVVQLHARLIDRYGGLSGIRAVHLLESALAMPEMRFSNQWMHADLFEMAAAYLFHLVKNHPFIDGNKRVGSAAALIFLSGNGIDLLDNEEGLVDLTLSVACGRAGKPEIAQFFRDNRLR